MVDLTQRGAGTKKQRAFHMNDETHARLAKAAELTNSTMSAVLDRLIWDDLQLPGDEPKPSLAAHLTGTGPVEPTGTLMNDEPEQPLISGRELNIAERQINNAGDVDQANAANNRAMERLKKQGHYATKIDGSDQREKDPGLVSKPGNDGFDL